MGAASIIVDGAHTLLDRRGMYRKVFSSDYRQIRFYTLLVVQKAPAEIREINLLEQQVSELIKNAIKHGNRSDPAKTITVWYRFTDTYAHVVVQDQGEGFQEIERWNAFSRRRNELVRDGDFEALAEYVSYRSVHGDDGDGGNALFAAVEYWNEGLVFDERRTTVAAGRLFSRAELGVELGEAKRSRGAGRSALRAAP